MRAYIGITGHFIEDYQLQGVMLACRRFEGIHTAENVLTNYEDIITQFNLQGKVGYIITDNAANMLKAFVKLPGAEVERGDDSESDEDEDQDSTYLSILLRSSITYRSTFPVSFTRYSW